MDSSLTQTVLQMTEAERQRLVEVLQRDHAKLVENVPQRLVAHVCLENGAPSTTDLRNQLSQHVPAGAVPSPSKLLKGATSAERRVSAARFQWKAVGRERPDQLAKAMASNHDTPATGCRSSPSG